MSATAETFKLCDYFMEYYGPPHNKHVGAPEIKVCDKFNYNITNYYLDDLYGFIPCVSKYLLRYIILFL